MYLLNSVTHFFFLQNANIIRLIICDNVLHCLVQHLAHSEGLVDSEISESKIQGLSLNFRSPFSILWIIGSAYKIPEN